MTDKIKTILMMARHGYALLPLMQGGKAPAIEKGVTAASKDLALIKKYFGEHPEHNWGIATGMISGIIALDVDGPKGRASLKALTESKGPLPKTVIVQTPNGWHYYFRAPGYRVPNSVSRIAKGIDVKGDGGYVVGPGSSTPDGVYKFLKGHSPDDVDIAPASEWLLKAIGKAASPPAVVVTPPIIAPSNRDRALAYAKAAYLRELDRLKKAPTHQRNSTLNICAFKLAQFLPYGLLSATSITDELTVIAKKIGLGDYEIPKTIDSGMRAGQQ
jgi:putative DNA primase/helicase